MDERLTKAVQWSIYAIILIFSLCILASFIVIILQPTFFPDKNISGFKDYINTMCTFVSFISVGLGVFSIYQANSSGKQASKMMDSLRLLEKRQELLMVTLNKIGDATVSTSDTKSDTVWIEDETDS